MTDILKIDDKTIPKFPKHVKFRYNKARDEWVILAPERLVKLDPIAWKFKNGQWRTRSEINFMELSKKFNAPEDTIISDVKDASKSVR